MWNRGGTKEAGENSQELPWERKLFYVTGDCIFFFLLLNLRRREILGGAVWVRLFLDFYH